MTTALQNDDSVDPSDALGMFNAGNRHTGKGCGIERDVYGHAIQAVHMRAFSWESSKVIRNRYIELNPTPTEAHMMEQGETQEDDMFGFEDQNENNENENSGNDNNLNPRGVTRDQGQRSSLINTKGLNGVVRNFVLTLSISISICHTSYFADFCAAPRHKDGQRQEKITQDGQPEDHTEEAEEIEETEEGDPVCSRCRPQARR